MMGLLKKASLLSTEAKMPDFFSYCKNNELTHFALLSKTDNIFFIDNSYGFDYESIIRSISTSDFWNGTVTEVDKKLSYANNQLTTNPLLQFFSEKIQKKINTVNVIKSSDEKVYLSCNQSSDKTDFSDNRKYFFNIDINSQHILNKYTIKFTDFLDSLVITNASVSAAKQKKAFFNEISNRILFFFSSLESIVVIGDAQITVYISDENLKPEILLNHVKLSLKDFYHNTDKIEYTFNGKILSNQEFNS